MLFLLVIVFGIASFVLAQSGAYGQCGGSGWTGATTCISGYICTYSNPYYSQCLPGTVTTSATTTVPSTTSKPISTTTITSATTTSDPSCTEASCLSSSHATTTTTSSSTSTSTGTPVTGLAASAPTLPPSKLTGQTPALGWNGWNAYGCAITEAKVLSAANLFVSLGMKAVGYEYVNIDDCWSLTARDNTTNQIVPDPSKFPNGIASVASEIHALGLKMGIYGDAGTATCSGFPGSLGYETLDASTFNSWGIDYLKYDNCNVPGNWSDTTIQNNDWYNSNSAVRYRQMGGALATQPNPIQFDLCVWGNYEVWTWGAKVGHSWRMASDASASWSFITDIITQNVLYLSYVDFFAHNDMDMLEIGNGGLTIEEQRTHFAMWVALKSPIFLGTDLSLLNSTQVGIVTNPELIAFHQDTTVGAPAMPFAPTSGASIPSFPQFYSGTSAKGTHVFLMNTASSTATIGFSLSQVPSLSTATTYKLHDMWAQADLSGSYSGSGSFSVSVAAHDTAAYLITAD